MFTIFLIAQKIPTMPVRYSMVLNRVIGLSLIQYKSEKIIFHVTKVEQLTAPKFKYFLAFFTIYLYQPQSGLTC